MLLKFVYEDFFADRRFKNTTEVNIQKYTKSKSYIEQVHYIRIPVKDIELSTQWYN